MESVQMEIQRLFCVVFCSNELKMWFIFWASQHKYGIFSWTTGKMFVKCLWCIHKIFHLIESCIATFMNLFFCLIEVMDPNHSSFIFKKQISNSIEFDYDAIEWISIKKNGTNLLLIIMKVEFCEFLSWLKYSGKNKMHVNQQSKCNNAVRYWFKFAKHREFWIQLKR